MNPTITVVQDSPQVIREIIKFISASLKRGYDYDNRHDLMLELISRGWKKVGTGCSSVVVHLGKYAIKISSDDFNEIRPYRKHPMFKRYAPRVYWVHISGRVMLCEYMDLNQGDEGVTHEEWWSDRKRIESEFTAHGLSGFDLHSGNVMRRKEDGRLVVVDYECFYG